MRCLCPSIASRFAALAAIAMTVVGCGRIVHVTSDPAGVPIYAPPGSPLAPFGSFGVVPLGQTPCQLRVPSGSAVGLIAMDGRRIRYLTIQPEVEPFAFSFDVTNTADVSPTLAAAFEHRVQIGMTADEVHIALGWPYYGVNRTTTVYGRHEQWVYSWYGGMDVEYVYLDNDIVTSIQN